jgi:AcrR family transcriptional regulator
MVGRVETADSECPQPGPEDSVRWRILSAAFEAFKEHGYAHASTLEIATRARVSKRELYALFGNKQQMLIACISERARRMRLPADRPGVRDRKGLDAALAEFGAVLLREISDPDVIAVFRLAASEADRAPEVAAALNAYGREPSLGALRDILEQGRSAHLLGGADTAQMAKQFIGLLWEDLMVGLILGIAPRPGPGEVRRRAREATDAFLRLHAQPARRSPPAKRRP